MNTPQDMSAEILTEIERDKVAQFCSDQMLFQAVKKYVLAVVYRQGVIEKGVEFKGTVNYALNLAGPCIDPRGIPRSDEELGQNLRALTYATSLVESGFKEMAEMKKPEVVEAETINPSE